MIDILVVSSLTLHLKLSFMIVFVYPSISKAEELYLFNLDRDIFKK